MEKSFSHQVKVFLLLLNLQLPKKKKRYKYFPPRKSRLQGYSGCWTYYLCLFLINNNMRYVLFQKCKLFSLFFFFSENGTCCICRQFLTSKYHFYETACICHGVLVRRCFKSTLLRTWGKDIFLAAGLKEDSDLLNNFIVIRKYFQKVILFSFLTRIQFLFWHQSNVVFCLAFFPDMFLSASANKFIRRDSVKTMLRLFS